MCTQAIFAFSTFPNAESNEVLKILFSLQMRTFRRTKRKSIANQHEKFDALAVAIEHKRYIMIYVPRELAR
jgi:hypothetical protein